LRKRISGQSTQKLSGFCESTSRKGKEEGVKRAYKYRLSPTRKQTQALQWTLDRCRELYNAALQERRDAYRMAGKHINYYDQANQLPEIKDIREEYRDIYSQVLQDVLRKADKAFKAFFRRVKTGETPGYPRYKGSHHFDSFTYPQGGFSLTHDTHVCLSKVGSIKIKLHRPMEGEVKTCCIKREGDAWYVVVRRFGARLDCSIGAEGRGRITF
jgi:putative transposase